MDDEQTAVAERCFGRMTDDDLQRMADLARQDRAAFFQHYPRWRQLYADRVLCVALCQGAALHYVDGVNGVKDVDVWTFYAAHPEAPFPPRRRVCRDFGPSHLGRHPADAGFTGRRVDLLGRSLPCLPSSDPVECVRQYLASGSTTARSLAAKAVVVLEPASQRGRIIWPSDELAAD